MQLIEANSQKTQLDFLRAPLLIYKNDPNWVRPLDRDIEMIFDKKKNKHFDKGEAIRWILKDAQGNLIGRIAAFYNEKTAKRSEYQSGGIGFFECINNQGAAHLMFDAAQNWLMSKGMECMDGPINFGGRDAWWGLMAEGFDPPTYRMNYNLPYYVDLFESYGFQIYFNQLVFHYDLYKPVPKIFYEKGERTLRLLEVSIRNIEKKKLDKYAADLAVIYNEAWSVMEHFKPVTKEETMVQMKTMKPIIDEEIIWFAYHNERPVGFFIMLPEINQIIRHLNGSMNLWGKLKFLYYQKRKVINKIFGLLFGIVPEFQGKGVEAAIIIKAAEIVVKHGQYKELEMNWVGDFNPKMIRVVQNLGTTVSKRYRTYRKIFDTSKPFSRFPIVN